MPRMKARPPPFLWFLLILPYGIGGGFISVAIATRMAREGVPAAQAAALGALGLLPHTWKFLWAPATDVTYTRRRWYIGSNLVGALALAAFALVPVRADTIGVLEIIVLASSLAATTLGMAVEALMAHHVPRDQLGRAAGWFQAGNLGGAGVGGALGLWLATHTSPETAIAVVVAVSLACIAAVFVVPDVPRMEGTPLQATLDTFRDLWSVVRTHAGVTALAICFLPIGSGGASYVFGTVSDHWHASEDLVALANGALGGLVAAVGCFVGGWMSDRFGRKSAYAIGGGLLALVAVAMAIAPRTPAMYLTFVLGYSAVSGICYGTFTGLVLATIGAGAAATKYNAYASLSNLPIYYMARLDGGAFARWGTAAMLFTDATAGVAGLVVFGIFVLVVRRR